MGCPINLDSEYDCVTKIFEIMNKCKVQYHKIGTNNSVSCLVSSDIVTAKKFTKHLALGIVIGDYFSVSWSEWVSSVCCT